MADDSFSGLLRILPPLLRFCLLSLTHRKEIVRMSALKILKFILETSSSAGCEETRPLSPLSTSPGPSRPYQCPRCPAKFDTAVEVVSHVAVCPGQFRVSDDDNSSLSTGVSTAATPAVAITSQPARNIKTDKVSDIKSSVTNVYIRFVQVSFTLISYEKLF